MMFLHILPRLDERAFGVCALTACLSFQGLLSPGISGDNCDISCAGHAPGDMIPDPLNCRNFYFCISDSEHTPDSFSCGDGMHFNDTEFQCTEGTNCKNLCSDECSYECNRTGVYQISDRYDCSTYYQCMDDALIGPFSCPLENQFFDGYKCQSEEDKCCNCKAYCRTEDTYKTIFDPRNCSNFYFCLEQGFPTNPGTCSSGHFDPFLGHCSETVPCITICSEEAASTRYASSLTCQHAAYYPSVPGVCDSCFYHCLLTDTGYSITYLCCPSDMVFCPGTSMCTSPENCSCEQQ